MRILNFIWINRRKIWEAAWKVHKHLKLDGRVTKCNAFALKAYLNGGETDLIASIRFFYYLKKEKRIELLITMAEVSRKYLLVQYKTTETRRGKEKSKALLSGKEFCSNQEILAELNAASLDCVRIVPVSQASDRVFAMVRNRK